MVFIYLFADLIITYSTKMPPNRSQSLNNVTRTEHMKPSYRKENTEPNPSSILEQQYSAADKEISHIRDQIKTTQDKKSSDKKVNIEPKIAARHRKQYTGASNDNPRIGKQLISNRDPFEIIKSNKTTQSDFYRSLKSKCKAQIIKLQSDPDGYSVLHYIVIHRRSNFLIILVHLNVFETLFDQCVPTSSPKYQGLNAVEMAVNMRQRKMADDIKKQVVWANSLSKFMKTCRDGDIKKVKAILDQSPHSILCRDSTNNNCLYWAIVSNNLSLFDYLLANGADISVINNRRENLLHTACILGHSRFIQRLIVKHKLDFTKRCSNKKTALDRLAENGDVDTLMELLKTDVYLPSGVLPLAAYNDRIDFIR